MERICPKPSVWNSLFERLTEHAKQHRCLPQEPPVPLILNGWTYSNDIEKKERWSATIEWAERNGCSHIVSGIADTDFYFAEKPSSYRIGPMGGPMYRDWDYTEKTRPTQDALARHLEHLQSHWLKIVGPDLASITSPLYFRGEKGRRLMVRARLNTRPPWWEWSALSSIESDRRSFTKFRAAINGAITPHEVDRVDFVLQQEEASSVSEK